jgi:hypothetical protein
LQANYIEQEFNYIKITVFHNKIAQNHIVAHFRHETIAKQFDRSQKCLDLLFVWYGMVWYGMVWYGMVWYGMVWYGMVWYGHFLTLTHTQTQ